MGPMVMGIGMGMDGRVWGRGWEEEEVVVVGMGGTEGKWLRPWGSGGEERDCRTCRRHRVGEEGGGGGERLLIA